MQRNDFIDIVKGMGIGSIVIGHASWSISIGDIDILVGPFVYLYHLAIFFFCSGYLFIMKEKLNEYIVKKIYGLYIPFVKWGLLFLVFKNLFIKIGIIEAPYLKVDDYIIRITDMITFNGAADFLSAFWFLPVLFFAMIIWALIYTITNRVGIIWKIVRFIIVVLFGVLGVHTMEHHFGLLYNLQIVYLMIPIIYVGNLFKLYEEQFAKMINIPIMFICFGLMCVLLKLDIGIIELSKFMIINKILFYPVTFISMWFCLCLTNVITKTRYVKKIFVIMGKNSLTIMALHFLAFKIIDLFVCILKSEYDVLYRFPYSYSEVWLLYYFAGIAFPLGFVWIRQKLNLTNYFKLK